ncbi:MAG: preprotein translocase subunit SecE [Actinomycetaceae bacterium]|nr:preprotein translocase subunit SecE [Actinomycetaceae bacterium]
MNVSPAAASNNARKKAQKKGLIERIVQFFKEVLRELKKVQRPTRAELWKLFLTVVFFVSIVMVFVGLLDLGFAKLVMLVFG